MTEVADTAPQTAAGKVLWHGASSLDAFVAGLEHSMDWLSVVVGEYADV